MAKKRELYESSDYAEVKAGKYRFYYGYEYTFCKYHGSEEDCADNDCDDVESCFVAWKIGKGNRGKEIMRVSTTRLEKCFDGQSSHCSMYLLAGIGLFIEKFLKK